MSGYQEDFIHQNSSPEHSESRRSWYNEDEHLRSLVSSSYTSSPSNLSDGDDEVDLSHFLIDFRNCFTEQVLNTDFVIQDSSSIGFSNFLYVNRKPLLHCWEKKIDSSILADEGNEPKSYREGRKPQLQENHLPLDQHKIVKVEDNLDEFEDKFASMRCKKFLRSKSCTPGCNKIHRHPKDDGVKCIAEKLGQCCRGQKCNYLHLKYSSESEDELQATPSTQNVDSTQDLVSSTVKMEEIPASDVTATVKNVHNYCSSFQLKQEPLETLLYTGKDSTTSSQNPLISTNSSSIDNSSTTTIITATTINHKTSDKRISDFLSVDASKKIKLESSTNTFEIEVKKELEEELFPITEDESGGTVTLKSDSIKSDNFDQMSQNVPSADVVNIPAGYQLSENKRLITVTKYIAEIINDMSSQTHPVELSSHDSYVKLCEYLTNHDILLVNETNNPKLLVWEVHIRLFFIDLLGEIDVTAYRHDIEHHLKLESFEDFMLKIHKTISDG